MIKSDYVNLNKGKIVKVYLDPAVMERLEGEAELIDCLDFWGHERTTLWSVKFIDSKKICERYVCV